MFGKVEHFRRFRDSAVDFGRRDVKGQCRISQTLAGRQVVIQAENVRQVGNVPVGVARVFGNVDVVDENFSAEGFDQSRQTSHQSGLAGAVRSDQGDDAAFFDFERKAVQSPFRHIVKDQVFNFYHRFFLD